MDKEEEKSLNLFLKTPTFMLGVADLKQLPEIGSINEVAFAGRSNVGKSSLINALFGSKNVAKTSSTPGRTQQMNYFNLANRLYLVDLPGYGYAKAGEQVVRKWQNMMISYLKGRSNLRRVFLLADSRHGLKKNDLEIMDMLDEAAVTYQVVLTKTDKINGTELQKVLDQTQKAIQKHPAAFSTVLATSSEKNVGLDELRAEIQSLI